jgi:riboflavin transporter FmnP
MDLQEDQIEKAVILLNSKLLGIVLGFLAGASLFLVTNILVLKGGPHVGLHLGLLSNFFPGYRVTFMGSIIGFLYASFVGFLSGLVMGAVYNKIAMP